MPRDPYKPLDPFRSPDAAADAVLVDPLTSLQRRSLLMYCEYREQPMRLGPLVRRMLPHWCGLAIALTAVGVAAWWALPVLLPEVSAVMSYIVLGMMIGALIGATARDMGNARRVAAFWPVLREVIDWNKVSQRLDAGK